MHRVLANHRPINDNLVSWTHHQEIANHDFSRVNLPFLAIPNDRCRRTRQQDDAFKRLLGMDFLHHAHKHIDEHHSDGDERITHLSEEDKCYAQDKQNGIDRVEDVFTDNLDIGPADLRGHVIAKTLCTLCCNLDVREALKTAVTGKWLSL